MNRSLRLATASITLLLLSVLVSGLVFGGSALADGGYPIQPTIQHMIGQTGKAQDQLKAGDTAGARATGEALEQDWRTVEQPLAKIDPDREASVDNALDAANAALASTQPADAATKLGQLQAQLSQLQQDLANQPASAAKESNPTASIDQAAVSQQVRQLDAVQAALDRGDVSGARDGLAAFHQAWPAMETQVLAYSGSAYTQIENQLTVAIADLNATPANVAGARAAVSVMQSDLNSMLGAGDHYSWFDSAITLLREGLEALLIIAALLAFLTRAGRPDLRYRVWLGAGAGVIASLGVAAALQIAFSHAASGINREFLEGATGLVAAAMLLYMSFWLHRQSGLNDWRKFVSSQASRALASGGAVTLPSIAFLAVFREGAETTILYFGMAAGISLGDLLLGMAVGLAGLTFLGLALFKFGLRLPIKPFFGVMSLLLYYLAFKFVGTGIHALQVAGALPATTANYLPSFELFGLFPTWQTTLAQITLIIVALGAISWLGATTRRNQTNRVASS